MEDEEAPLIKGGGLLASYSSPREGPIYFDEDERANLKKHGITDTMKYETKSLTTWESFQITYTTVWVNPELWRMMFRLAMVTVLVCIVTVLIFPNPERLKVGKFTSVSKFLNVVCGLLMGFFMSSSMNRWYSCVDGFMSLLNDVRNLQMQFIALGVPDKEMILCLRYAFVSAWLLYGQLLAEAQGDGPEKTLLEDEVWTKMMNKLARIDREGKTMMLQKHEVDVLRLTRDPPCMMWVWNSAHIGRLAQDGWIPPMPSPTYGRIMNLCQAAHSSIRQVRASISVHPPLAYTHMLATLVHINNLLNAVTLGLVSGLAIGTTLIRNNMHLYTQKHEPSKREVAQDLQNMAVTFLYCFFGPLLYQALLLISMHLAQPFASPDARMPLDRLLHNLEIDMCNGRDVIEHMPFEKPFFKKSPSPTESK